MFEKRYLRHLWMENLKCCWSVERSAHSFIFPSSQKRRFPASSNNAPTILRLSLHRINFFSRSLWSLTIYYYFDIIIVINIDRTTCLFIFNFVNLFIDFLKIGQQSGNSRISTFLSTDIPAFNRRRNPVIRFLLLDFCGSKKIPSHQYGEYEFQTPKYRLF